MVAAPQWKLSTVRDHLVLMAQETSIAVHISQFRRRGAICIARYSQENAEWPILCRTAWIHVSSPTERFSSAVLYVGLTFESRDSGARGRGECRSLAGLDPRIWLWESESRMAESQARRAEKFTFSYLDRFSVLSRLPYLRRRLEATERSGNPTKQMRSKILVLNSGRKAPRDGWKETETETGSESSPPVSKTNLSLCLHALLSTSWDGVQVRGA